jgi:hypothetical protein
MNKAPLAIFLIAVMGCSKAPEPMQSSIEEINYEEHPPAGFSGSWSVYSAVSGKKSIEVTYSKGQKNGVEMRYYPNSGFKMSLHNFADGRLAGSYCKWRNSSDSPVLAEGEYMYGKPWNGVFLEHWDGQVDLSLNVQERDVPYICLEYSEGSVVRRFKKP